MASLHEYFLKDGSNYLRNNQQWSLSRPDGTALSPEITATLCMDFEANSKFVWFYVPDISGVDCAEMLLLNQIGTILAWPRTNVGVIGGFEGEQTHGTDLTFTGRITFYSERPVREEHKQQMIREARNVGHHLTFRSTEHMEMRNKLEKPMAFISHDSRDKELIAGPLAIQLQKFMCPVWYDDFTLKVGDSLRESIEAGLKECPKCILILTPNFLSNEGWTKREYDSVFTREVVEKQKLILPIWHNVGRDDVFKYSMILADRVAAQWSLGVEEVGRRLVRALNA
jgi:TIR domain